MPWLSSFNCRFVFISRFNPETGLIGMSYTTFKTSDLRPLGKLFLSIFSLLKLVHVEAGVGEDKESTRVNNLTLLNFVLKILGPLHERTLTLIILGIQVSLNLNLQYINRSLILNFQLALQTNSSQSLHAWGKSWFSLF